MHLIMSNKDKNKIPMKLNETKQLDSSGIRVPLKESMLHKVVEIGKFEGYHVSKDMDVRLSQFTDDTMILGNGSWNNLWSIKAILENFEVVSRFKVNFYKSKIYGVNVDETFMKCASQFLCYCRDDIPFKFLGIPLGANPRRRVTSNLVFESLKNKLQTWKARMFSFWGKGDIVKLKAF